MDRKAILILVVCYVLLMLWPQVVRQLYPPRPRSGGVTNLVSQFPTGAVPATVPAVAAAPATAAGGLPAPWLARLGGVAEAAQAVRFTNAHARYFFTSRGGGLERVELIQYPETITRRRRDAATNRVATLNAAAPVPVLAVLGEGLSDDGQFELQHTGAVVHATKALTNGLVVTKQFTVTTNYLIAATVRLENRAAAPLALPAQEYAVGTATPMGPDDDGSAVGLMWFNGAKNEDISAGWFANRTLGCFPGTPRSVYSAGQSNVVWASAHNQFFALVAMPRQPAQQVVARQIDLPRPADGDPRAQAHPAPKGYVTTLVYPATTLAPGQALERQMFLFAGPKEYRTLARVAAEFGNGVDAVMGFGGFFGFFAKALLLAMNWLHDMFRMGYGWAIIAITVIIKALFWPLTQVSTHSMKRLQALQPQMKALQEKYKDDPVKMNKKLMEFMKEHKVSPLSGCLPTLVQMPVFIGFFYMIRSAIELRGARFLWIADLSKPDTLFELGGFPVNLLPLIMGATMLWQSHMTPASPGMDPVQQKMMKYLPLMFLVFLYNFSAGLTLYWTVQNLLSIVQMKLTLATQAAAPVTPAAPRTLPPKKRK